MAGYIVGLSCHKRVSNWYGRLKLTSYDDLCRLREADQDDGSSPMVFSALPRGTHENRGACVRYRKWPVASRCCFTDRSEGGAGQSRLWFWTSNDRHAWRWMSQGSPCGRHVCAEGETGSACTSRIPGHNIAWAWWKVKVLRPRQASESVEMHAACNE
jgi:hypothetical protein